MDPNNKVLVLPNICGIGLYASGTPLPISTGGLQPFYNTYVQESESLPVYTSPGTARFSEKGGKGRSGLLVEQTLQLSFPHNDLYKVLRLDHFKKAKYVYIKLSGGRVFFFGRNDYYQNAALGFDFVSNEKITQITYTCKSTFAIGFTNGSFDFQLSEDMPINFYNL